MSASGELGRSADRAHELVVARGRGVDRILVQRRGLAGLAHLQPVLVKRHQAEVLADLAEAVDVAVADRAPVDELDAELEGALGRARRKSVSSMSSAALNSLIIGIVASPTPTVPIASDSTSRIE